MAANRLDSTHGAPDSLLQIYGQLDHQVADTFSECCLPHSPSRPPSRTRKRYATLWRPASQPKWSKSQPLKKGDKSGKFVFAGRYIYSKEDSGRFGPVSTYVVLDPPILKRCVFHSVPIFRGDAVIPSSAIFQPRSGEAHTKASERARKRGARGSVHDHVHASLRELHFQVHTHRCPPPHARAPPLAPDNSGAW